MPKRLAAAAPHVLDRGAQAAVDDLQHQAGSHVLSGSSFSAGSPISVSHAS